MKTIEDYLRLNYTMEVIKDPDEGGFVVSFPELPGCLTCGQSLESALANALDAKKILAWGCFRRWFSNSRAKIIKKDHR